MNGNSLASTIKEAERFIRIAKEARRELGDDKDGWISGTKKSGACRRASMDLTRSLAEMRKP